MEGIQNYPKYAKPLDEMFSTEKQLYYGNEIMLFFKPSSPTYENSPIFYAALAFTVFVNLIADLLVLATGNIQKMAHALELLRSLAEISLLVFIGIQSRRNQYNSYGTVEPTACFVLFWFASFMSVSFGLLKSVACSLKNLKDVKFSRMKIIILLIVFGFSAFVVTLILGIIFVVDILAFVVILCISFYAPFLIMWILDLVRFVSGRNKKVVKSEKIECERLDSSTPGNQQHPIQQVSLPEISIPILFGFCHTVASAVVTTVIVRIIWTFFRPSDFIQLQGLRDILMSDI